jgi:hypothetical protein
MKNEGTYYSFTYITIYPFPFFLTTLLSYIKGYNFMFSPISTIVLLLHLYFDFKVLYFVININLKLQILYTKELNIMKKI